MLKIYGPFAENIGVKYTAPKNYILVIYEPKYAEIIRSSSWKYKSLIAENVSLKIYGPWKFY